MGTEEMCGARTVGPDGTVVEHLPDADVFGDGRYFDCCVRWWPALFQ